MSKGVIVPKKTLTKRMAELYSKALTIKKRNLIINVTELGASEEELAEMIRLKLVKKPKKGPCRVIPGVDYRVMETAPKVPEPKTIQQPSERMKPHRGSDDKLMIPFILENSNQVIEFTELAVNTWLLEGSAIIDNGKLIITRPFVFERQL